MCVNGLISICESSFDRGLESPGAEEDPKGDKSQVVLAVARSATWSPAAWDKISAQQIFSSTCTSQRLGT